MVRVFFFIVHSSEHNAADTKEGTDDNDKVFFFLIRKYIFFKKVLGGLTYMTQMLDITYSINYSAHEFWFESELRLYLHYIKICCAINQWAHPLRINKYF